MTSYSTSYQNAKLKKKQYKKKMTQKLSGSYQEKGRPHLKQTNVKPRNLPKVESLAKPSPKTSNLAINNKKIRKQTPTTRGQTDAKLAADKIKRGGKGTTNAKPKPPTNWKPGQGAMAPNTSTSYSGPPRQGVRTRTPRSPRPTTAGTGWEEGLKTATKGGAKKLALRAAGAAGGAAALAAGAVDVYETVKFKQDKRRPNVRQHAAGYRYDADLDPNTGRSISAAKKRKTESVNNMDLGIDTKGIAKNALENPKGRSFNVTTAGTGAKGGSTSTNVVRDNSKKTQPSRRSRGNGGAGQMYNVDGKIMNKADYKKHREGLHATRKAAALADIKAKRGSGAGSKYRYKNKDHVMGAAKVQGNESRNHKWESRTDVNDQLQSQANGTPSKKKNDGGFWNRPQPTMGGRSRKQWFYDQVSN